MPDKKKLIIIAHAPSVNTDRMLQAVIKGANHPDITNVDVRYISPLDTQAEDIKSAQAIIIGTTENLGYMAGLIKDVFDRCYYDCLDHTQGLPFTFYGVITGEYLVVYLVGKSNPTFYQRFHQ
ncbi:MAG: hypothetical protein JKY50_18485 [Oleispira sp.]|nr:hypothetical protein [Oleispira sp.]